MDQVSNTSYAEFFVKCKFSQGKLPKFIKTHNFFYLRFFVVRIPNFDLHFLIQRIFPDLHAYKILQN